MSPLTRQQQAERIEALAMLYHNDAVLERSAQKRARAMQVADDLKAGATALRALDPPAETANDQARSDQSGEATADPRSDVRGGSGR